MPEEFALLMRSCWEPEPASRPSFDQVVTCLELMLDNLSSEGSRDGDRQHVSDMLPAAGRDGAAAGRHGQAAAMPAGGVASASVPMPAVQQQSLHFSVLAAQQAQHAVGAESAGSGASGSGRQMLASASGFIQDL